MSEDLSNPPFKIGDLITLDKDKCSDYLYASGAYPPGFVVEVTAVYLEYNYTSKPHWRFLSKVDARGSTTNGWCCRFFKLVKPVVKKSRFSRWSEKNV